MGNEKETERVCSCFREVSFLHKGPLSLKNGEPNGQGSGEWYGQDVRYRGYGDCTNSVWILLRRQGIHLQVVTPAFAT